MLTGKQKRYLRSMAHHLDPVFQVGKNGTNEHLMRHINDAIEKRELMKVQILNNCLDDKHEIAEELAAETGSGLVQI
ncbi:ribosome assembly RNA-binding protein YhbY, partial [Bacillus cereus]|nr:ribosome assembly RNA-binding protein YhbY [Bacillus cereus]